MAKEENTMALDKAQLSFLKTYRLTAHSPLIHFQYNQKGATLRATEVKPKLDRYLKHMLGDIPQEWKLPEHEALNYKMSFNVAPGGSAIELGWDTPYDIFYGNMGNGDKKGIQRNVTMTVICMIPELLEAIDEHIAGFFITHNFGTMQSKGFGSFTVNDRPCDEHDIANALKQYYGADKKCYTFNGGSEPFKRIKTVYSIMKSGQNFRHHQRSLLFLQMHTKGIGNEKACMKQEGLAPTDVGKHASSWQKNGDHPAHYVRALLGVGDHIDFIESLEHRRDKTVISITGARKGDDGKPYIERLQSPILFKVINNTVYYIARDVDERIFGEKFRFAIKETATREVTAGPVVLKVPTKEQLGDSFMEEFLAYCMSQLNSCIIVKNEGIKISEV